MGFRNIDEDRVEVEILGWLTMDLVGWTGGFDEELVVLYGIVVWMRVFYENHMGNIHVKTWRE